MTNSEILAIYQENFPELWRMIDNFIKHHGQNADHIEYENVDWDCTNVTDAGVVIISSCDPNSTSDLCMHHEEWTNTSCDPKFLVYNLSGLLIDYVTSRELYPWLLAYERDGVPTLTAVQQRFEVLNTFCEHVMPGDTCLECHPTSALKEFNVV